MTIDLSAVVDGLPHMVWTATPDGKVEFLNQRWREYTGLSADDTGNFSWVSAVHPDDQFHVLECWTSFIDTGQGGEVEARFRRADGEYRWFLFHACPMQDKDGRITRWCGTNIDIADRKQADTQLSAEKSLLEMIIAGRPLDEVLGAVCRFVEEISPECLGCVYPIDRRNFVLKRGVGPSLPATFMNSFAMHSPKGGMLPCGRAVEKDRRIIVADIQTDPIWRGTPYGRLMTSHGLRSVWSNPIRSLDGRILGALSIYQTRPATPSARQRDLIVHATQVAAIALDRSESNEALKARDTELERTHRHLTEAQRLSKTGSFTLDLISGEQDWSDEMFRICDLDLGKPPSQGEFLAMLHPDDEAAVRATFSHALESESDYDLSYRIRTRNGAVKHLHSVGQRMREITGRPVYVGATQDVTDRIFGEEALNRARMELAHVSRITALSTLTASIAHEVNQPLAGILANASTCLRMLAAEPPDTGGARATAQRTIRDANRAAEVIKRLRDLFARRHIRTELVDLNDAAREVLALTSGEAQRSRTIVKTCFAEDLPPVMGDRVQLQQVVLNLVLNAIEAMREIESRPRELLVTTAYNAGDNEVHLCVRDTGTEAGPEQLEQLFAPFYTTKAEGMGVGLSVSRSIIDAHNGRLWASRNEHEPGLTFSFSIRLAI